MLLLWARRLYPWRILGESPPLTLQRGGAAAVVNVVLGATASAGMLMMLDVLLGVVDLMGLWCGKAVKKA